MPESESLALQPICTIEHWGPGQDINDLFLTIFEDRQGGLCAKGRWDRNHNGGELDLSVPRSVVIPVYDHKHKKVSYSHLDLKLLDVSFCDAQGKPVTKVDLATSAHSQVFVPEMPEQMLRLFLLNAEGHHVLPGHTKVSEAKAKKSDAKNHGRALPSHRPARSATPYQRQTPIIATGTRSSTTRPTI